MAATGPRRLPTESAAREGRRRPGALRRILNEHERQPYSIERRWPVGRTARGRARARMADQPGAGLCPDCVGCGRLAGRAEPHLAVALWTGVHPGDAGSVRGVPGWTRGIPDTGRAARTAELGHRR